MIISVAHVELLAMQREAVRLRERAEIVFLPDAAPEANRRAAGWQGLWPVACLRLKARVGEV